MKKIKSMFFALSMVFTLAFFAFGQETTGNIEGTVKDATGAVVPNMGVTVELKTGGFKRTVSTNGDGFFRLLQVPPGEYTVTTTAASGFGVATYENVRVVLGKTTQLSLDLKVGQASAVVDVSTSDTTSIDTTGSEISKSISAEKLALLPKGVTFTAALKAVPGTRPDVIAGGFSVDGATNSENVFVIDGQEVTNYHNAGINANNNVPFQIVQELQVKSSGFDAEYGGATGGVINVVSKGGSNDFHGEFGIEFQTSKISGAVRPTLLRFISGTGTTFLQPTEYFTAPRVETLNTFRSGNFSGPIVKNKLWFFGSYSPQVFESTVNTTFYTNVAAATRTINTNAGKNGTDTYSQKQTFEYGFLRLDAQPFSKLRLSGTYLWNPQITQGLLPFGTASFGGTDPVINFGGTIGKIGGSELRSRQGGRNNATNVTGQGIYTVNQHLVVSGRYSRGFLNERGNNYFVPSGNQYVCTEGNVGATTFPGACDRGDISPSTTQSRKDVSIRNTYEGDATVLFSAGGRHQIKGGYSRSTIFNDIEAAFSQTITLCYGATFRINAICGGLQNSVATPNPLAIGGGALSRFGTKGIGSNLTQAVYIQDKWQPFSRLTLNIGIRTEKEDIPSYNRFPGGFNFDWKEKIAPRLGFAFDLFGDGKTKLFGSFGKFYNRLAFAISQGSFGADFFRVDYFDILPTSGNFTGFTTASIVGNFTDPIRGACPTTGFIGNGLSRCQTDLRVASNDPTADPAVSGAIDPNAKPYQQRELTFGIERDLSTNYLIRARFTDKKLLNAIEDAGVANAAGSEIFITGNPGQGAHEALLKAGGYNGPYATPKRRYDAMEIVLEKRLSNNYYFNVNYTLSRLYGNYSGLANTDELSTRGALNGIVRSEPGVNRSFDLPFIGFTAAGKPDDGRLASDRPHVFNAYGAYIFNWGGSKSASTELSLFQTIQSGTPQTTFIQFDGATTVFTKRGDLGRSPVLSQTDLGITQKYKFGKDNRFAVVGEINVLNLFDQDTVTTVSNVITNGQISNTGAFPIATFPALYLPSGAISQPALINAYNKGSLLAAINTYLDGTPTILNRKTSAYKQANRFQPARGVRFGFRLVF
jgi:Carboxypeptidase regulatory-like domain/TonB-dependent Receptor Plug Domain